MCYTKDTIAAITHFSFHSHTREFKLGYFVIEEGIRAGISGIYNSDGIITDITGVCFRISRTVIGCANELIKLLDNDKGLLICGGVNSGKTTILRDICRIIGNKYKVALIDERNEIATISEGKVCNDVGILTSIMSGCTRSVGIISSIRSLSPEYIICDEIADDSDTEALILGAGCGIKFIATVHANNYEALKERPFAKKILSSNLFSHAIFLSGAVKPGSICSVYEI